MVEEDSRTHEVSRSFAPHGRHLATGREAQFVPQIRGANLCHKPPRQTCESQVRLRSLCATISVASSERVPPYSPSPISPRRKRGGKRERESNVTACNSEICYRVRQPPVAVRIQILAVTDSYDSQKTRVESYLCPSESESALFEDRAPRTSIAFARSSHGQTRGNQHSEVQQCCCPTESS